MSKKLLPRSSRKFLRREKSRVRRDTLNREEAEKKIFETVSKFRELWRKKKWVELS